MATFGRTTTGGTQHQDGGTVVRGSKFTLSEDATATSMSIYAKEYSVGTPADAILSIYADNAGNPGVLQGITNAVTINLDAAQWWTANFASPLGLIAGDYWLIWGLNVTSSGIYYYDDNEANAIQYVGFTYPTFPNPFGSGTTINGSASIYVTYTAGLSTTTSSSTSTTSTSTSTTSTSTSTTSTSTSTTSTSTSTTSTSTSTTSTSTSTTSTSSSTTLAYHYHIDNEGAARNLSFRIDHGDD